MFCDYVLLKIVIVRCSRRTFAIIKTISDERIILEYFGNIGIDFNVGVMRKG